ncbi:MAG: uroporphyrinogen decarboxylase family protein [bacterium]
MNHRERAITAITGGTPDYVPTFELVFHETERDLGGRAFFGPSFEPDAEGMSYLDIVKYNARLYVDIARRYGHSIIFVNSTLGRHEPGGQDPYATATQGVTDMLKEIRALTGGEFLLTCHNDPTFMIPFSDAEEFCVSFFTEPQAMRERARRQVEQSFADCDKLMAAGADGFILCCDYCTNQGSFFSPKMFREFIAPYLKQCVAEFKRRGAYVIKHTDGDIMPILDELIDAEPHALHSLDPMAGVDIRVVKERCRGKIALCGNVHCAHMQTGTPQQIRESAEYCLRWGKPGGGYVFCTSNSVFRGMPLANYDLIQDIWIKNRDY